MSKYFIEDTTLTDIGDAIRLKRDITTQINPVDMPLQISLIEGGGGGYSVNDILEGKISGAIVIEGNPRTLVGYAFAGQPITSVTAMEWVGVYSTAIPAIFSGCRELSEVNMPMLKLFAPKMFENCSALTHIKFPAITNNIGGGAFMGCTNLRIADLGWSSVTTDQLFQGCSALDTLILRYSGVCPIKAPTSWAYPLKGTKFETASGTVYCPSNLIESYKTATNWSTIYNSGKVDFRPLEEAPII